MRQGKAHEPFVDENGAYVCVNSRFISTEGKKVKYCTEKLTDARINDILMVMSDLPNGKALAKAFFVEKNPEVYAVNQRVCAITVSGANPKFLYYQMSRSPYFLQFDDGVNQTHLSNYAYQRYPALLPDLETQNAIVIFLDREIARIDSLISEKNNFVNLLKEKRQALISHVVTKGLDTDVEMKDRGVEWIGEIPKHWDMIKFSHFVTIRNGQVDPKEYPWCDYILIAPNHIESKSGRIVAKETAQEQGAESGKYLCKKGEVIYSKIRPALAKACLSEDDEVICSADMYPMNCNYRMLNQYLLNLILSNEFTQLAILESGRVAMPKINRESLAQIKFPVPPLSEQEKAIDYIQSKTRRIDGLIEETKTSIDLLKEHRTALISAAVTGKIDLRNKEVA